MLQSTERRIWFALLILGITSFIIFVIPNIFYLGIALLVVPGLIIWATPPVFMYGLLAMLVWAGLRPLPKSVRLVSAALAVIALANIPPTLVNDATERDEQAWISSDVSPNSPIVQGDTIALLQPPSREERDHPGSSTDCDELCQRLLFNGAFKRVLMANSAKGAELKLPESDLVAYHLEQRKRCPATRIPTNNARWSIWDGSLVSSQNARDRVAFGECLIEEHASIKDADLVFVERDISESRDITRWSLKPFTYGVRRIELLQRKGPELLPLYRLTQVDSNYIARPFVIGISDWQFPFAAGFGILQSISTRNRFFTGQTAKDIFGSAIKAISPGTIENAQAERLLAEALADPSLPFEDARFSLADRVLNWISHKRRPAPKEDAHLVYAVAHDDRFKNYIIPDTAIRALGTNATPAIDAIVDRLFTLPLPRTPVEANAMSGASFMIWKAPPGALAHAVDRLKALAEIPGRRGLASLAIGRVADGGASEGPYLGGLVHSYRTWSAPPTSEDENLVKSGLMGLCRLGKDGNSQRQAVIDLLRDRHRPGAKVDTFGHAGMITLMEMGATDELDAIFAGEPELLSQAHDAKERSKKVNWQCRF